GRSSWSRASTTRSSTSAACSGAWAAPRRRGPIWSASCARLRPRPTPVTSRRSGPCSPVEGLGADRRASDPDPPPLLPVRHAAHAPAALSPHHDRVAPVEAAARRRVVEAGLLREAHALAQHRVVPERDVGRLVALDAFAVPRPVVDVLRDALRRLVLVDGIGHRRAGDAFAREIALHVAGLLAHFPQL